MRLALKWEVPHKEGLQNWAHEESQTQRTHQLTLNMKNKNWLLRWRGATEGKIDDGRKGLAKWVNVKIRCNKGEVFCRANEWAFQVKATEEQRKRWNCRWKDHLGEKIWKIPKRTQLNNKWMVLCISQTLSGKKKSLPIHISWQ